MDAARSRLAAEREQSRRRLAELTGDYDAIVTASYDDNADDEHDPEGATIAFERSQLGSLIVRTRQHLAEVAAAVQRLDDGSYGVCERCGQPISASRLEARPASRHCMTCATAAG